MDAKNQKQSVDVSIHQGLEKCKKKTTKYREKTKTIDDKIAFIVFEDKLCLW